MVLSLCMAAAVAIIGFGLTAFVSDRLRFEERIAIGIVLGVLAVSGFWERKLDQALRSFPGRDNSWWGPDRIAGDVERRRVRAWTTAFYGGPIRTPHLQVEPVLEFIAETARAWADGGHRVERMHCDIPVELHRLWCVDLVAPADGSGRPMWAGISVKAEVYLQAPQDWVRRALGRYRLR